MRIVTANTDDRARWDQYVRAHPNATPYHLFGWKLAMEQAYGVRTHYLIAEDDAGKVLGVLPSAAVPRLLGKTRLCGLPYCDRGDPLSDNAPTTEALLCSTLASPEVAPAQSIEVRTDEVPTPSSLTTDPENTVKLEPAPGSKVRMLLPLPDTAEELLAGFKSKHRSQIRKAMKNGLTASIGNSPAHVEQFYEVYAANMRDLGSPPHSLAWFQAVASNYSDDCAIGIVRLDDVVVGSGIVLRCGHGAAIPWASTLRSHNHLAPNMLLYWTVLEHTANSGCREFDFGRSGYGEGTYRFKAQWGATPRPLRWRTISRDDVQCGRVDGGSQEVAQTTLAGAASADTAPAESPDGGARERGERRERRERLKALFIELWRRLPVPVSTAIGSRLRKYIDL